MIILLLFAALLGGLLTSILLWFWLGNLAVALLVAPLGGSFAALLAAAFLAAVRSSSIRAFFASWSQGWSEKKNETMQSGGVSLSDGKPHGTKTPQPSPSPSFSAVS